MQYYINRIFPEITVVRIHSETCNIFRYDENISFVQTQLLPKIQAYRDAHACSTAYPDELQDSQNDYAFARSFDPDAAVNFHVSISFADGSPARTHAIQTCLRGFHPTYLHIWQLKTFWHDGKICSDDLEVFSFNEIETTPALDVNLLDDKERDSRQIRMVIHEMLQFKMDYLEAARASSDVRKFWLRKTKKPVLSVLLVKKGGDGKEILYRGTNMEVSMPTGSLCAERNVIGTALAADPGLKRGDLRIIAVLAVPFSDDKFSQDEEVNHHNIGEVLADKLQIVHDARLSRAKLKRSSSVSSFHSIVEEASEPPSLSNSCNATPLHAGLICNEIKVPPIDVGTSNLEKKTDLCMSLAGNPKPFSGPGTPKRKIRLYEQVANNSDEDALSDNIGSLDKRHKRTIFLQTSTGDINPLKPCGACNEWLKKIAESNPYFKVLTFTDADCNGVYVTPCQE
mmetsp:Transcript_3893/g.5942  ORF Transcript_3893/g.5942 Transcript_3893/m.5942 type:complete len:455 (-) Transcript_3893:464-1828(-)